MAYYRLYYLDPSDHISRCEEYDAPDDEVAVARASGSADQAPRGL